MWLWLLFVFLIYAPYVYWAHKTHRAFAYLSAHNIELDHSTPVLISIIIPFRNETSRIATLIKTLQNQIDGQENIEVILVNDHSTDDGNEMVNKWLELNAGEQFKLEQNSGIGKKAALTTGIRAAKGDWIITLDADVTPPDNWSIFIQKVCASAKCDLVILPVEIKPTVGFLQKLEALEFTVLQGITFSYASSGKPILANGAHLAFTKRAFFLVNGYESHSRVASGDDIYFLEEINQHEDLTVGYAFYDDMRMATLPSENFRSLLHQKIRWGRKTSTFKSQEIKLLGALILVANFSLFILAFSGYWKLFLLAFIVKSISDLYLVFFPMSVYAKRNLLGFIPLFMLVYPFYIIFVSAAAVFINPKWKGRSI